MAVSKCKWDAGVLSILPLNIWFGVKRVALDDLEESAEIVLCGLRIVKNVSTLLVIDL